MSGTITGLFGVNLPHIRLAKIVTVFYCSRNVYDGIAGVMNAFFIGETYANFGVIGVLVSIIYYINKAFSYTTQGGFFDFIYGFNIILILLFVFIDYSSKYIDKFINNNILN